jgi:tRNA threonylcarbamoyl adenosine modification protein (Sua5/YciO/YrdC/YwlC family)
MSPFFEIHPGNPQVRLIQQTAEIIRRGGVVVYPTDSAYALGCHLGDKAALDRICRIRNLDDRHHFTLICRNLSEVGSYARFDTPVYRLLKASTPGPYTFLLPARREVPRRLMHPKKKTIGLRIPDHHILQAILTELQEPMFTTTLILPGETLPMTDPTDIHEYLEKQVDLVIDGGACGSEPTTLVDLTGDLPVILRTGRGDPTIF